MYISSRPYRFCAGALLLSWLTASPAAAEADHGEHRHAEAHVHGEGQLSVASDGSELQLSLVAPAGNFLGFEHQPENDDEMAAARALHEQLMEYDRQFEINSEAGCSVTDKSVVVPGVVTVASPDADHRTHEGDHDDAHGHQEPDAPHADVEANYTLTCEAVGSLASLHVKLFDLHPGFSKIEAVYLLENRQSLQTLEPDSSVLLFR